MEVYYSTTKVERIFNSLKSALKFFNNGDKKLAVALLSCKNDLENAETIKDIIVQPRYHFHKLFNKNGKNLEGYFAIDVMGRRSPWRIVLQPLNEEKNPFDSYNIDLIASIVRIIQIKEVSNHYD